MDWGNFALSLLAAGGGGAVIAFGIIKAFGEKWLDSKFDSRLETMRHEHARQMESLRLETSRTLDRATRLTEREFDVSAEAWSLVYEAYSKASGSIGGYGLGVPDFNNLSEEMTRRTLEGGLFGGHLEAWEIDHIMAVKQADRESAFIDRREEHDFNDTEKALQEAHRYLSKNALFLEKIVHKRLTAFVGEAGGALVWWSVVRSLRKQGAPAADSTVAIPRASYEEFLKSAAEKIEELEHFVRERFWGRPAR